MRILLLKDKDINNTLLGQVQLQVEEIYRKNTDIKLDWSIEEMDYSDYPVEEYNGWPGYWGIQQAWLRTKCAEVYTRWREETDMVVFLVDSSNWRLTGVWGWAISKAFSGYGVLQVRFANNRSHTDIRNVNNTVGTLYHEMMHDHDTFVYTYTGQRIEPLVGVSSWDSEIVHGESPNWAYIRHNENQEALRLIASLLRDSITKRRAIFTVYTDLQRQIIQLLEKKVLLLRQLIAQQKGDVPILKGNKCKK